jgi:predicted permease
MGRGADVGGGLGRMRLTRILVIVEVAVSLVLLIGAVLFARSLGNLKAEDIGVDRSHLMAVWTAPNRTGRRGVALSNLYRTAQQRLSMLPGVTAVTGANNALLSGYDGGILSEQIKIPGLAPKPGLMSFGKTIAPGYVEATGMRLLEGREFLPRDTEHGAPPVVILNETMARFFFDRESALGRQVSGMQVVGVVKDAVEGTPRAKRGVTYVPYHQDSGFSTLCLMIRTAGNPAGLRNRIRQELRDIDPALPVVAMETVDDMLDNLVAQDRLIAALAGYFGGLAGLLACLGLYGVVAYTTARRTNEIGIRLALGATRLNVLGMVLRESLGMVGVGIVLGVAAEVAVLRLIATRLFGIRATDPSTIILGIALLMAVAAFASLLPAQKASRVDPMVALRYE